MADYKESKFKLVTLGSTTVSPHECCSCRGHSGLAIDFGVSFDYDGAIYFCVACLEEAASIIGMSYTVMSPIQPIDAEAKLKEMRDSAIDALDMVMASYYSDRSFSGATSIREDAAPEGSNVEEASQRSDTSGESSSDGGQDVGSLSNEGPFSFPTSAGNESRFGK